MKVKELLIALKNAKAKDNDEIKVWLPGSTISLSNVFSAQAGVLIEGNVDPGSALDIRGRR